MNSEHSIKRRSVNGPFSMSEKMTKCHLDCRLSVKRNCPRLVPPRHPNDGRAGEDDSGRGGAEVGSVDNSAIGVIKANSDGQDESIHTSTWFSCVKRFILNFIMKCTKISVIVSTELLTKFTLKDKNELWFVRECDFH